MNDEPTRQRLDPQDLLKWLAALRRAVNNRETPQSKCGSEQARSHIEINFVA